MIIRSCWETAALFRNVDGAFLQNLRDQGREAMARWLDENFDNLGVKDTVDLHAEFLSSTTKIFHHRHGEKRYDLN